MSMGLPLDWVASGLGQNCGHKGHAATSLGTFWGFLSALWHLVVLASSGGRHGPRQLFENLSHSCDCFGCPHLIGSTLPIPTFLRMSPRFESSILLLGVHHQMCDPLLLTSVASLCLLM